MIIHVVQSGETINSIADQYQVSADRLIIENGIRFPDNLVVGETLVILYPETTYIIKEGDTLESIADSHEVSVLQLLRNNPYLSDREYIYPGETIVISYAGDKLGALSTNCYAYPFIDINVLNKTLPFLTYLTVFSYQVTIDGELNDINDTEIIQAAKSYDVAPIMMLTAASESMEDEINIVHTLLSDKEIQNQFIDNLIHVLQTKGYRGVSINTPYILPTDRNLYENFITELADHLSNEGYIVIDTFSIRIFQLLNGMLFEGIEYSKLGQIADGITLISYEFGYSEGVPPGTTSLDSFRRFVEYTARLIPPMKLSIGLSVIGYVWGLPYIPGISKGMAISYDSVIDIAREENAEIQFDEITNTAYFNYVSTNEYVVRFKDARCIDNFVKLVPELGLGGISIWNIMSWFPQMWLVINSQYNIDKIM